MVSLQIEDMLLLDVTSQSLGIETAGGEMAVLIHKNSTIPMNVRQNFTTFNNNQDNVKVQVAFDLDANGILSVSAMDKRSGNKKVIKIKNDKGRLTEEEIGAMIKSAKKLDKIGQIQQARKGKGNVREIMAGTEESIALTDTPKPNPNG
eukprot:sb/3473654/